MLCYALRYAILCYDIVHTDWTCSCRNVYEFLKRMYYKPMLKQTQSTSYWIFIIVLTT